MSSANVSRQIDQTSKMLEIITATKSPYPLAEEYLAAARAEAEHVLADLERRLVTAKRSEIDKSKISQDKQELLVLVERLQSTETLDENGVFDPALALRMRDELYVAERRMAWIDAQLHKAHLGVGTTDSALYTKFRQRFNEAKSATEDLPGPFQRHGNLDSVERNLAAFASRASLPSDVGLMLLFEAETLEAVRKRFEEKRPTGVTEMSHRLDPKLLASLFERRFREAVSSVARAGGMVAMQALVGKLERLQRGNA